MSSYQSKVCQARPRPPLRARSSWRRRRPCRWNARHSAGWVQLTPLRARAVATAAFVAASLHAAASGPPGLRKAGLRGAGVRGPAGAPRPRPAVRHSDGSAGG
eukprot:scaffold5014_cov387-Prasinococcus_capsulatus_cf.AAC.3